MTGLSSASRQLRRTRWTMTALFATTTALCLLALALLAIRVDDRSRAAEVGADVTTRATALARAVYYADSELRLGPLDDDELALGAGALAVVQEGDLVYSEPDDDATPTAAWMRRTFLEVRRTQEVVRLTAADRTGRKLEWAAAPVWDDDEIGAVVMVGTDPAPQAAAHDRFARLLLLGCLALALLAALVGHLLSGRAMRPALAGLAQQEQFLAEAAHELRTPLTTLRLVAEAGGRAPERAVPAMREVTAVTEQLGRLVENLLTRARLRAGTVTVTMLPTRLDQLVEAVVEDLPGTEGVRLETDPSVVELDGELVAQAVRNLVENALRHGAGAAVTVSTAGREVRVRDAGPGLDAARREQALEAGVSFGGGTGTGLAIVRWVAEVHGGVVRLEEAEGGGLLVILALG